MTRHLSKTLTSYDFLKTLAVLLMIADHVGYYFFPDENGWRVAGRLCVPIWFFLIGYARSRDLGVRLWIGAAVLVAGNIVAGMSVFPLNILATMLAVRMLLGPVATFMLAGRGTFWSAFVLLALAVIPTHIVTEYGTLGIIMALCGYLQRLSQDGDARVPLHSCFLAAVPLFIATQCIYFVFTPAESAVTAVGVLVVAGGLLFFRPAAYPAMTARMPGFLAAFFRLGGRRTLEIYVIHLLVFKALGMVLHPELFTFMDWTWFPSGRGVELAPSGEGPAPAAEAMPGPGET